MVARGLVSADHVDTSYSEELSGRKGFGVVWERRGASRDESVRAKKSLCTSDTCFHVPRRGSKRAATERENNVHKRVSARKSEEVRQGEWWGKSQWRQSVHLRSGGGDPDLTESRNRGPRTIDSSRRHVFLHRS